MTAKFLKVRIEEAKRDAFLARAKADGMTMTDLIQSWIDEYLGEKQVNSNGYLPNQQVILERLEAVEKKLEASALDQSVEDTLGKQIQYVDQRIDTLESVVITPLKDELHGLKNSWKALFNQMRGLEEHLKQVNDKLEDIQEND